MGRRSLKFRGHHAHFRCRAAGSPRRVMWCGMPAAMRAMASAALPVRSENQYGVRGILNAFGSIDPQVSHRIRPLPHGAGRQARVPP